MKWPSVNLLSLRAANLVCLIETGLTNWGYKWKKKIRICLGEYAGPLVSLHVRPGMVPRFMKARPVPSPLKQQVEDELCQMIEDGVFTPIKYFK